MERPNEAARILEEEYGIRSMAELNAAIDRIGPIDISPFCAPINQKEKEKAS